MEGTWARVLRADETQVPATTVYNLTVAGLHTFFVVGENDAEASAGDAVLVHNARTGGIGDYCGVPLPNRGDLKRLSDYQLEALGIDAHDFKYAHLGERAEISKWDIYRNPKSGELFLVEKQGDAIVSTGEYA